MCDCAINHTKPTAKLLFFSRHANGCAIFLKIIVFNMLCNIKHGFPLRGQKKMSTFASYFMCGMSFGTCVARSITNTKKYNDYDFNCRFRFNQDSLAAIKHQ